MRSSTEVIVAIELDEINQLHEDLDVGNAPGQRIIPASNAYQELGQERMIERGELLNFMAYRRGTIVFSL
jgi:hypothetical protein